MSVDARMKQWEVQVRSAEAGIVRIHVVYRDVNKFGGREVKRWTFFFDPTGKCVGNSNLP